MKIILTRPHTPSNSTPEIIHIYENEPSLHVLVYFLEDVIHNKLYNHIIIHPLTYTKVSVVMILLVATVIDNTG